MIMNGLLISFSSFSRANLYVQSAVAKIKSVRPALIPVAYYAYRQVGNVLQVSVFFVINFRHFIHTVISQICGKYASTIISA